MLQENMPHLYHIYRQRATTQQRGTGRDTNPQREAQRRLQKQSLVARTSEDGQNWAEWMALNFSRRLLAALTLVQVIQDTLLASACHPKPWMRVIEWYMLLAPYAAHELVFGHLNELV